MEYDSWFDTDENKALLAICARKLISNIGIGGIVWGLINIGIGIVAIQATLINVGILILGVMMLGTGIQALRKPSLRILLAETIVTILLFVWNLGITILNFLVLGVPSGGALIFPIIIAIVFFRSYRKLRHVEEQISSVEPEKIKATKQLCKALVKKKLKDEPTIIQTTNRRCRAQLMDDRSFFIQRDLMRAFVGSRGDIRNAIVNPEAKRLKLQFMHPLGKLKYQLDKKSSEKLRDWLSSETESIRTESGPTME